MLEFELTMLEPWHSLILARLKIRLKLKGESGLRWLFESLKIFSKFKVS